MTFDVAFRASGKGRLSVTNRSFRIFEVRVILVACLCRRDERVGRIVGPTIFPSQPMAAYFRALVAL
ncbi:hypothetical protein ACMYR2_1159 [Nitrobacter sp. TKz-YC01]